MLIQIGTDLPISPNWIALPAWENPLPFEANVAKIVYCARYVNTLWWGDTVPFLTSVWKILRPEGILELWAIDFEEIQRVVKGGYEVSLLTRYAWLQAHIYGNPEAPHRSIFPKEYLHKAMRHCGFNDVRKITKPRVEFAGQEFYFGLTGIK